MNNKYFSDEIIEKWSRWKNTFESYQQPYYQLIIAQNMQISRYTTEESVLAKYLSKIFNSSDVKNESNAVLLLMLFSCDV